MMPLKVKYIYIFHRRIRKDRSGLSARCVLILHDTIMREMCVLARYGVTIVASVFMSKRQCYYISHYLKNLAKTRAAS